MADKRYAGGWDPSYRNFEDDGPSSSGPPEPWRIRSYLGTLAAICLLGWGGGIAFGDFAGQIKTNEWNPHSENKIVKEYRKNGGLIGLIALPTLFLAASGRGFYEDMKNKYGKK